MSAVLRVASQRRAALWGGAGSRRWLGSNAVVAADEQGRSALVLYRQILRAAQGFPTPTRREFVWRRARSEFEAGRSLLDPGEIERALQLAGTQLQTLQVQAPHLSKLQAAMPERFESSTEEVGLVYADTSGERTTRVQISPAARDLTAEVRVASRQVSRMERNETALREMLNELESFAASHGTANQVEQVEQLGKMRGQLESQTTQLLAKREQLSLLTAEAETAEAAKQAKELEQTIGTVEQGQVLRASADPAEQSKLEELWVDGLAAAAAQGKSEGEGEEDPEVTLLLAACCVLLAALPRCHAARVSLMTDLL